SAIPNDLFESEFFGYDKGAFTGANIAGKKGFFEMAKDGTLFLDEIADLPLFMQSKLLRALEDKQIKRVGAEKYIEINTRIIAATNKSLEKLVEEGKFREDLYYRLNVIRIKLPPLRERKEDIIP
ncbi:sigma 54-interacting transcriptional regulator, partial [Vibrio parahaemolyticus]|nr:sigma 54-interacting transcriptional regulator [Vibrio parahaemolyticus]